MNKKQFLLGIIIILLGKSDIFTQGKGKNKASKALFYTPVTGAAVYAGKKIYQNKRDKKIEAKGLPKEKHIVDNNLIEPSKIRQKVDNSLIQNAFMGVEGYDKSNDPMLKDQRLEYQSFSPTRPTNPALVFEMDHNKFDQENQDLVHNVQINKKFRSYHGNTDSIDVIPELLQAMEENKEDLMAVMNFSQYYYNPNSGCLITEQFMKNIPLQDSKLLKWGYSSTIDCDKPNCDMRIYLDFHEKDNLDSISILLERKQGIPTLSLEHYYKPASVNTQKELVNFMKNMKNIKNQLVTMDHKNSPVYLSSTNKKIIEFFEDEIALDEMTKNNKIFNTTVMINGQQEEIEIKPFKSRSNTSDFNMIQVRYKDSSKGGLIYTFEKGTDKLYSTMKPIVVNYLNFNQSEYNSSINYKMNNLSNNDLENFTNVVNAVESVLNPLSKIN